MKNFTHSISHFITQGSLLVGIAILFTIALHFGLNTLYPEPDYFYEHRQPIHTEEACLEADGNWTSWNNPKPTDLSVAEEFESGYCEETKAERDHNETRETHAFYSFIILTVISILVLVFSQVGVQTAVVRAGLLSGAILSLIVTTMRFWDDTGDLIRLLLILIALGLLIWLGTRSDKDE